MTASDRPAPVDTRVSRVVQAGVLTLAGSETAKDAIGLLEEAGLLVLLPDEALVERIRDALDRHQYAGIQHAASVVGGGIRSYDDLSQRTRRLRYDQFIDAARVVLAALATPGGGK